MAIREYPDGLDCVWLASDRNGNLGAFVTGGVGPIPISALSNSSFPIEDVEAVLCELPQVSEVQLIVPMKRPDDFIGMARCGFFVYDWRDVHRTAHESTHTYELVAAPLNPITTTMLPEHLKRIIMNTRLPNFAFIEERVLDIAAVLECRSAD